MRVPVDAMCEILRLLHGPVSGTEEQIWKRLLEFEKEAELEARRQGATSHVSSSSTRPPVRCRNRCSQFLSRLWCKLCQMGKWRQVRHRSCATLSCHLAMDLYAKKRGMPAGIAQSRWVLLFHCFRSARQVRSEAWWRGSSCKLMASQRYGSSRRRCQRFGRSQRGRGQIPHTLSRSNVSAESTVEHLTSQVRTLRAQLEMMHGVIFNPNMCIWLWLTRHASRCLWQRLERRLVRFSK